MWSINGVHILPNLDIAHVDIVYVIFTLLTISLDRTCLPKILPGTIFPRYLKQTPAVHVRVISFWAGFGGMVYLLARGNRTCD